MSRIVNSSVQTALEQPHIAFAAFVEMAFASGTFRAFNGVGQYSYNGQTYTGLGKFGGISGLSERIDARDFTPLRLSLSGVPADLFIDDVPDRAEYFNRSATIYFVAFNPITFQPLAAEPALFEGFMDQMTFKREGTTASIGLTVRHHSSEWQNIIGLLHTHEHQRLIDSSDDSHNKTHEVEDKSVLWGGVEGAPGGMGGRDGPGPRSPRQKL